MAVGVSYEKTLASASSLDLAKTLEDSYAKGTIGTNRTSSLTTKSFLLSKHV
jgi:hypothetical protein